MNARLLSVYAGDIQINAFEVGLHDCIRASTYIYIRMASRNGAPYMSVVIRTYICAEWEVVKYRADVQINAPFWRPSISFKSRWRYRIYSPSPPALRRAQFSSSLWYFRASSGWYKTGAMVHTLPYIHRSGCIAVVIKAFITRPIKKFFVWAATLYSVCHQLQPLSIYIDVETTEDKNWWAEKRHACLY